MSTQKWQPDEKSPMPEVEADESEHSEDWTEEDDESWHGDFLRDSERDDRMTGDIE